MSDTAILVENLGKQYRIGKREPYKTLTGTLTEVFSAPFRRFSPNGPSRNGTPPSAISDSPSSTTGHLPSAISDFPFPDTIWALKDVSFEIKQGEVVGVIGRNGAGKSTLLKILSRITEPTKGHVRLRGRVGSLLEVGTGFHPELTGRENIYLNGAVLGMKRADIDRKFDEIVAFAEIEKFLDTPVKHYSSGMYMRLAFAVAAHLEPEILLVDEVLAVGDAAFQKKCLGKMGEVAKEGRTIVFVSHQMNAVRTLCEKALILRSGEKLDFGESDKIIALYLNSDSAESEWLSNSHLGIPNSYFNPTRFAIVDKHLNTLEQEVSHADEFGVLIEGVSEIAHSSLTVGFAIYSVSAELLFWSLHTDTKPSEWPKIKRGQNKLICWIPRHLLNEGDYRIEMIVSLHFVSWLIQPGVNAPTLRLSIRGGLSESPFWMMARPGILAPILKFSQVSD